MDPEFRRRQNEANGRARPIMSPRVRSPLYDYHLCKRL